MPENKGAQILINKYILVKGGSETFNSVAFVPTFMQIYAWYTHNATPEGATAARNASYANLRASEWRDMNVIYLLI